MTGDTNPIPQREMDEDDTLCEYDIVPTPGTLTPLEDAMENLGIATKPEDVNHGVTLRLNPLPERDGVIVSVMPPLGSDRVPCDVVLVIDISGSMGARAPAPDNAKGETEIDGLTVLDLTKQAARAIVEIMDERDRLGIVTFTDEAQTVLDLTSMTKANKTAAWEEIKRIRPMGLTNMWHGILQGKELLDGKTRDGCMPAMMLLTDGLPNKCNPPQGWVARLRQYELPAPIHTFGFGYEIGSCLLQSISEVAGGNYAFISDASMLATVFIHAIAHLQSTYAPSAEVKLTATGLKLEETMGTYIRQGKTATSPSHQSHLFDKSKTLAPTSPKPRSKTLTVPLGSLQFGQSREIFLKYSDFDNTHLASIHATFTCSPLSGDSLHLTATCTPYDENTLSNDQMTFHRHRASLCAFVNGLAPVGKDQERKADLLTKSSASLEPLITRIRSSEPADEANQALLEDLSDQMSLALSAKYINTWGFHYLLSMYNAHFKQLCTSFKDPGPLQYNQVSPVFRTAKDQLSDIFDQLPPPKPSVTVRDASGGLRKVTMSMKRYHNSKNPCFAEDVAVKLANGTLMTIESLRPGITLWTPVGPRRLAAIVATPVEHAVLCQLGDLKVTPWHPVCLSGSWEFPAIVPTAEVVHYTGKIYSLLLERDENNTAHSVEVGGILAVTLGHGICEGEDPRAHAFLGDYQQVQESLERLPLRRGIYSSGGTIKDESTRLVCGFAAPETESQGDVLGMDGKMAACVGISLLPVS